MIEPALQAAEMRRSAARPTNDLTAYDLYLRAYANTFSSGKGASASRESHLDRTLELDPCYGSALAAATCASSAII